MYTAVFSSSRVPQEVSFFADLEHLVPLFNSNKHRGPGQAKVVTPVTTETPRQAGFLKSSWKWKSLSHSLCLQEAYSNSISAPGKSYYRAKRLEKNSTWYQSTRTGAVSKLIDLSPCNQVSLWQSASLHSGASNLWRCYFVGFQTFKKKKSTENPPNWTW